MKLSNVTSAASVIAISLALAGPATAENFVIIKPSLETCVGDGNETGNACSSSSDLVLDGISNLTPEELEAAGIGGSLDEGDVGSDEIEDGSITSDDLGTDSVDTDEIADDAVTSDELADDAVDTAAIQDDAVTSDKIATDAVTSDELADDAVDTAAIQDDAVTSDKIATGAVEEHHLSDGVKDYISAGNAYTLEQANNYTDQQVGQLRSEVNELSQSALDGVAMALAAQAPTLLPGQNEAFTMGMGYYDGGSAIAFGYTGRLDSNTTAHLKGGIGLRSNNIGVAAGVTWAW